MVASDVRERRLALLQETVRRANAGRVSIVRVPTQGPLPLAGHFDRVLVDAPCSGLGTIRRDPDIRWRRHEDELEGLARDQFALLMRAADVVRPGGRLVYSTCSSEPEENDGVVAMFVSARTDFRRVDLRGDAHPVLTPFIDAAGVFRTAPDPHGLEAFFAAGLVRA